MPASGMISSRYGAPEPSQRSATRQDANLGGLAGADSLCQHLADAAGLPGTYVA